MTDEKPKGPSPDNHKFGTFGGVFTPCTLTILGVIMFLRFGQVVGQSGAWNALIIVRAAKAITTLTGFSLSAIATNTRVKGGGAWSRYYIAEYAYWLAAGQGVVTLGQVIAGEVEDRLVRGAQAEKLLRKFIRDEELRAFPVVVVEDDLGEGIKALLQCHGIGGIRPNTVLLVYNAGEVSLEA